MSDILGPDISRHQGQANIAEMAKHCQFAIFRAGYGGGGVDEQFARNRDGARKAGLVNGSYFFAYPGRGSGKQQALEYLKIVGDLKAGEFLALDVEDEMTYGGRLPANMVDWSLDFLRTCFDKTGVRPLVYMNLDVHNRFDWSRVIKEDYGLWLAYWDHSPKGRTPAVKWPFVAIEQYTSSGSLPGVSGRIDMNVFHGSSIAQLKAYGKGGSTSTPKPSPTPSPVPAPSPKENPVYTVRRGDTLGQIGAKYGIDWNRIVSHNKKKYPTIGTGPNQHVEAGWTLSIPLNGQAAKPATPKSIIITVPSGPSGYLGSLARQYGTTVSNIIALNRHKYPKIGSGPNAHIEAGWVIRVR